MHQAKRNDACASLYVKLHLKTRGSLQVKDGPNYQDLRNYTFQRASQHQSASPCMTKCAKQEAQGSSCRRGGWHGVRK